MGQPSDPLCFDHNRHLPPKTFQSHQKSKDNNDPMTEQYEGIGSFSILKWMIQLNFVGVQRREVLLAPKQQGPLTRQAILPVTDGVSLLISVPKCHLRASDTSLPKFRCPCSLLKTLHLGVVQLELSLIYDGHHLTAPKSPSSTDHLSP